MKRYEPTLKKKKKKKKKQKKVIKIFKIIKTIIFIILISLIITFTMLNIKKIKTPVLITKVEEKINYDNYYYQRAKTKNIKKIYELVDNKLIEIGNLKANINISLEKDEYKNQGYFKIKNSNYYVDYQDLMEGLEEVINNTYLNYIPFNETCLTKDITNFYLAGELVLTINKSFELPIIIKEDDYYGVLVNEKLLYLKKSEVQVIKNINTNLKYTKRISALTYHFIYDATNEDERKRCLKSNVTICLSDTTFKKQLSYLKENNYYSATMKDLELFIDGKVQLPENTVVITIDDGYFVKAAIKVLEELNMHATLFLIGTAGNPEDYQSNNLEIHSHSYAMHYQGACSGGQGSPFKCLNKKLLLEDLKKSREQLNNSEVFCYPFFEYNDYAISILKEAGFKMAFTGGCYKIKVGSNKYKLPRYGIINTTTISDIKKIVD